MDKILIKELGLKQDQGKARHICVVACPDCLMQREIRLDAFKAAATTCCRRCTNLRRPTKQPEELFDWRAYYHSKVGKLSHLYQTQRARCEEKGWHLPTYSQEELTEWALAQSIFHQIFDAWVASDFEREMSPSIDRLDDYLSYSLSNIRIVPWHENNNKGRRSQIDGQNTKNSLAVDQLDLDGNFIKRFHSVSHAARELSIDDSHIGQVCHGKPVSKGNRTSTPRTAGGYRWRFSSVPNDNTMKH